MHVMLLSFGAAGDVHPFIALGASLRERGSRVTMLLEPSYERWSRSLGLCFASIGEAEPPPAGSSAAARRIARASGAPSYLLHYVIPRIPRTFAAIEAAVRADRPDMLIVHHGMGLGTPWIAAKLGVAWGMAAVAPASWISVEQFSIYPGMPDRDTYPAWSIRAGNALGSMAMSRAIDPALNRVRRSMGLPRARRILFDEMFSGSVNLGLWSVALRPAASDDPPRSIITGFPLIDQPSGADDDALHAFIDQGEPPVLFTIGTSIPYAAEGFFHAAARACEILGVRGVLVTGAVAAPREPPLSTARLRTVAFASFSRLVPRCAAVVHHGGLGTIARCLYEAKPMLCVPHAHDQFDNASRCRRMGVSRTIDRKRLDAHSLAGGLRSVLASSEVRSSLARVSKDVAREDFGAAATRAIEASLGSRP